LRFRLKGWRVNREPGVGKACPRNLPGPLLLLAGSFKDEPGVWGKVYRGRFRGEERRSEDLISTSSSLSVMLRFPAILVAVVQFCFANRS